MPPPGPLGRRWNSPLAAAFLEAVLDIVISDFRFQICDFRSTDSKGNLVPLRRAGAARGAGGLGFALVIAAGGFGFIEARGAGRLPAASSSSAATGAEHLHVLADDAELVVLLAVFLPAIELQTPFDKHRGA